MKKRQTKAEIREELERQVRSFIEKGGEIQSVDMGASGLEDGKYDPRHFGFESSVKKRTPLDNLLVNIDSRRKHKSAKNASGKLSKQPRKKVIYDDFGEPLRWVWVDD